MDFALNSSLQEFPPSRIAPFGDLHTRTRTHRDLRQIRKSPMIEISEIHLHFRRIRHIEDRHAEPETGKLPDSGGSKLGESSNSWTACQPSCVASDKSTVPLAS